MVSPFGSPCSSPRKSRNKNKNPYSSRGLDKFSALLSELEEKRQKIYSKIDSGEAPLVRFVFTSSGECVPLIIKPSNIDRARERTARRDAEIKPSVQEPRPESESRGSSDGETKHAGTDPDEKTERKPCALNVNLQRMKRPSHYLPVTVILVLVFLAFFGRSVAIMCTCIAWYLVPTIRDHGGDKKMAMMMMMKKKKKSFTRKLSNESRGSSFNPRTRDVAAATKERFPCLAARGRSS